MVITVHVKRPLLYIVVILPLVENEHAYTEEPQ